MNIAQPMAQHLVVDDSTTLPSETKEALSAPEVVKLFKTHKYYEDIEDSPRLQSILSDIEQFALANGLAVFHCTRELCPGKFASEGLRILEHQKHVDEFMSYVGDAGVLQRNEVEAIEPELRTWRDGTAHAKARDGNLFFLHSREEVAGYGCQKFFQYYGGEALYWPFGPWAPEPRHWFLDLLRSIGAPVVVEAKVDPRTLCTGSRNCGADIAVSYFARSINPSFHPHDRFCFSRVPVPPERMVSVTPLEVFVEDHDLELEWNLGDL